MTVDRLDAAVRYFAEFLKQNWSGVRASTQGLETIDVDELIADWTQANWELLVEPHLREQTGCLKSFLEPYGDGAECNDSSSRVWLPNAIPTHRLVCRPRSGEGLHDMLTGRALSLAASESVEFEQFAARGDGGWYKIDAPFDCVLGSVHGKEVLIPVGEVAFLAEPTHGS